MFAAGNQIHLTVQQRHLKLLWFTLQHGGNLFWLWQNYTSAMRPMHWEQSGLDVLRQRKVPNSSTAGNGGNSKTCDKSNLKTSLLSAYFKGQKAKQIAGNFS